jgi:hypothetical protein
VKKKEFKINYEKMKNIQKIKRNEKINVMKL